MLVWNTVRITEIVRGLEGTTGKAVPMEDIARVSPLAHAHVIPSGTYHFPARARSGACTLAGNLTVTCAYPVGSEDPNL